MSSDAASKQKPCVSAKGVRLKQFERVVAQLLERVTIDYVGLPSTGHLEQLWQALPPSARVYGHQEGQLSDPDRAERKEQQIQSMLACIRVLVPEERHSNYTIVDLGGGSGHLAIPLALLMPESRVIVVDLKRKVLHLLHSKAQTCADEMRRLDQEQSTPVLPPDNAQIQSTAIPNLFTYHGPVEDYTDHFDMGVSLHLCGSSTDAALRLCGRVAAQALVVAPCCVGKVSTDRKNPYTYQATGSNVQAVAYPQSQLFCQYLTSTDDWNALAKAADYSSSEQCRTARNAARRTAKALLETDRRRFLEDNYSYETALTRMQPWEATPKNDILLGWKPGSVKVSLEPDPECLADIQQTIDHIFVADTSDGNTTAAGETRDESKNDAVDWTQEELRDIEQKIDEFLASNELVLVFPAGMGRRKRKLIHYAAAQKQLAHWGQGEKFAERTVAVARRGTRKERDK